ncbi:MAG: crossover junction endodeoxyribonuclease RuvC [Atribacter sp.]|jgi:crossover junction endodeoxyribonuclease RuvC|uniref:Crossover junction endodeoxyribonuclease RuvC n=1 Tax=Candidatus Atribacter allofermentans TaxID=1852833 RepID=A0A1V5T3P9_9BACT|nr:crossover junction endodeoxyribonuclease RuvC [Atribacterota bacterium]OQA61386.1 MAG: Crossover junction endodeoxyribonuclease RuvC [Candidatus Atribacteria bacterium ADurb.Bin276]HHT09389.1 crossover junction endodeoxyribonuclease RuvC [Candidatus Atribacteria bacterium]
MSSQEKIVLGIDPGTATTGYGIIAKRKGSGVVKAVKYGVIVTKKELPLSERLFIIYQEISQLINNYHPAEVAVEEIFFNKNSKTAISVGEARGVILLNAAMQSIPVFEYTPLQVKQSVVGYGRAKKDQVIYMVKTILNIQEVKLTPDDVADALAVAICHAFQSEINYSYV